MQPMSKLDLTTLDDEKLSDEDLKRHRVGGRLVTRREIMRSKKCMLFSSLIIVRTFLTALVFSHQSTCRVVP